jgi:exoribonuclease-2
MFPAVLSEDLMSLVAGQDRYALSFIIEFDRSGQVLSRFITPSLVRVKHRLTYDRVDAVLQGHDDSHTPELRDMLLALWEVASYCEAERLRNGALQLSRREVFPVVEPDGRVHLESWDEETPARKMVSELMIQANLTGALYASSHGLPLVYRSQEGFSDDSMDRASSGQQALPALAKDFVQRVMLKPSISSTVPLAHVGLAVPVYAQMTSPIRRYTDLINQRQTKGSLLQGSPPFSKKEVDEIIAVSDHTLSEARLLQRERTRYWFYKYLVQENIKELPGTVVRVDGPKPLVELDLFASTFLFRSNRYAPGGGSLRVGDRVILRVEKVDPRNDDLHLQER